ALLREVWAAGYLLGSDCARLRGGRPVDPARLAIRSSALESWLRAGIGAADLASLTARQVAALRAAMSSAVAAGQRGPRRPPGRPADRRLSLPIREALTGLAKRDARALSRPPERAADDQAGLHRLDLVVLPCPWCGATEPDKSGLLRTLPLDGVDIVSAGADI